MPAKRWVTRADLYDQVLKGKEALDRGCTVEEGAVAACMSPEHFQRVFLEVLGLLPRAYASMARLEQAVRLLTSTHLPVGDVGRACGYSDPSAFSRAFRRRYGNSPSAHRAKFSLPAQAQGRGPVQNQATPD